MNDIEDLIRADARRWRACQEPVPDIDPTMNVSRGIERVRARRALVGSVAATVIVVAGGAAAITLFQRDDRSPTPPAESPSGTSASPAPRLPQLGSPDDGQRTLLAVTGTGSRTSMVARSSGRGRVYAACIGGGRITVAVPGHGGFDVDCTGTAAGASLPSLGRTVRVTATDQQTWRIAAFGG